MSLFLQRQMYVIKIQSRKYLHCLLQQSCSLWKSLVFVLEKSSSESRFSKRLVRGQTFNMSKKLSSLGPHFVWELCFLQILANIIFVKHVFVNIIFVIIVFVKNVFVILNNLCRNYLCKNLIFVIISCQQWTGPMMRDCLISDAGLEMSPGWLS